MIRNSYGEILRFKETTEVRVKLRDVSVIVHQGLIAKGFFRRRPNSNPHARQRECPSPKPERRQIMLDNAIGDLTAQLWDNAKGGDLAPWLALERHWRIRLGNRLK